MKSTKHWLELDGDGYLCERGVPEEYDEKPVMTWLEFFERFENWSSLNAKEKKAALEMQCLEEDQDLSELISEEAALWICSSCPPISEAMEALRGLENDVDAEGVLNFIEVAYFDYDGHRIELVGTEDDLQKLLKKKGLFPKINIKLNRDSLRNWRYKN